jgi:hypothetical protein
VLIRYDIGSTDESVIRESYVASSGVEVTAKFVSKPVVWSYTRPLDVDIPLEVCITQLYDTSGSSCVNCSVVGVGVTVIHQEQDTVGS